jgi:SAM-dependent methyltransferase
MSGAPTFDPVWEEKYAAGHAQRYPWDMVVSFVFRQSPRDRPRAEVGIVELGFGTGANLWFAAREGFSVAGIEGSATAVAMARRRFTEEGLAGDLRVGDFTRPLPFASASADLVIDRGALTHVGLSPARATIAEAARILRPGGSFLFAGYSKRHAGYAHGTPLGDGLVGDITAGHFQGFGQVCFYDREDIAKAFGREWAVESIEHVLFENETDPSATRAEWRVIARRSRAG